MMTEEDLSKASYEIDDALIEIATKYEMIPMQLAGVVLARLLLMAQGDPDFFRLLNAVSQKQYLTKSMEQRTLQ